MRTKQNSKRDGFIIRERVLSPGSRDEFFCSFRGIASFFIGSTSTWRGFDDEGFSSALIGMRSKQPDRFSALYDTMLSSAAIHRLVAKNRLDRLAGSFLRVPAGLLYMHGVTLRMDVPGDTRNVYGWHQDSAYDGINSVPQHGCVIWAPLVDTDVENGTLVVCPGSHIEANHMNQTREPSPGISRQITTPESVVAKYERDSVPVKAGGAIISYANLIHKSGVNSSKTIRFTLLVRFNVITTPDFFRYERLTSSSRRSFPKAPDVV